MFLMFVTLTTIIMGHDSLAGGFPRPSIAAILLTGQTAFLDACVRDGGAISKQELVMQ